MADWPKYASHKIVQAAKVVDVVRDGGNPEIILKLIVDPGDGQLEEFECTHLSMTMAGGIGGWAMLYPDGFKSFSPSKQFEESYARIP